jgi:hypothetical protein
VALEQLLILPIWRRGAGQDRDAINPTLCCAKGRAPLVSKTEMKSGKGGPPAVDSGADHRTSTDGLLSAAGAFVADLAAGQSTAAAVGDANKNLNKDPKTDKGDKVIQLDKKDKK